MFAIIENATGKVVSVAGMIRYTLTQPNGMTVATEPEQATAVYTADDDAFWPLKDSSPGDKTYRVVTVPGVPSGVSLDALVYQDGLLVADLERLRESKLTEMSLSCRAAIVAGCEVVLADGSKERFSLEETDQINLTAAATAVAQGAVGYPYHADGQLCRLYPAADIGAIATAATAHKLFHTTYCNHVMTWVRRAESVEELTAITYGADLPDDLQANMEEVLKNAEAV